MTDTKKPSFKPGAQSTTADGKRPKRKEVAAVWTKATKDGEPYLSIKVITANGDDLWLNAFKNKHKKPEETNKPDYIAFERTENA